MYSPIYKSFIESLRQCVLQFLLFILKSRTVMILKTDFLYTFEIVIIIFIISNLITDYKIYLIGNNCCILKMCTT